MNHHHFNRRTLATSTDARFVADMTWPLVEEATGHPALNDCYFLLTLVENTRPSQILEVGVASGASSLMMLRMIEHLGLQSRLVSVDLAERYFADPGKSVGYLVTANWAPSSNSWTLLTSVQSSTIACDPRLPRRDSSRAFDLLFIDANHGHPWPTLDALCLLPFAVPGAWIAFHDINLPLLGDYPLFGAVYAVKDWPLDVLISDEATNPNIGAIQLSDSGAQDAGRLIKILERPWDSGVHYSHRDRILAHLETYLAAEQLELVERSFRANAALGGS